MGAGDRDVAVVVLDHFEKRFIAKSADCALHGAHIESALFSELAGLRMSAIGTERLYGRA
ncbi:hypothetical protein GCM10009722_04310 [Williamsia deligens]